MGNKNMYTDLEHEATIEFQQDDSFLFKIPCKAQPSPCKISLKYSNKFSKITAYLS